MNANLAKNGIAYGIILGAVLYVLTREAYWIALGVAIGAGISATAKKKQLSSAALTEEE